MIDINISIQIFIAAIIAIVAVHWIFPRVVKIAKFKGLVDNPDARKLHRDPIPVLGGIAVFFGLVMGMVAFEALNKMCSLTTNTQNISLLPMILSGSVMLYIGSLDDIQGLTPKTRLVVEIIMMIGLIFSSGMCVDSLHGLWGIYEFNWWIAVPLTVFAGVGLINAYNMVDGVNGLSSGLCIACSCLLATICWKQQDYEDCALALCFASALVPFLLHNVFGKRSRMFIGDGGTMVMGMLVSWFMIRILWSGNTITHTYITDEGRDFGRVAMMLAVTCVPVFDTLRVMLGRILRGVSPLQADKTHLHHVFIGVGISHSITALSEILINLIVVALWYITYHYFEVSQDVQLYVVIIASVSLVWGMYFFLNHCACKYPNGMNWAKKTHLGHTSWWLSFQEWLDKGMDDDNHFSLRQSGKENEKGQEKSDCK